VANLRPGGEAGCYGVSRRLEISGSGSEGIVTALTQVSISALRSYMLTEKQRSENAELFDCPLV
jgi:hypothetical protein